VIFNKCPKAQAVFTENVLYTYLCARWGPISVGF